MQDLKLCIAQTYLHWEDAVKNIQHLTKKIATANPQNHVIVLPEMFTSGFSMNAAKVAQPIDGLAVKWMQETAELYSAHVIGSLAIKEGESYCNKAIVASSQTILSYNKKHLFSMAKEHETYSAGNSVTDVEINGWKIRIAVCYDLRFPVWLRNNTEYDLLLLVANWPERRVSAWRELLKARAIENQCYVAAVNRVGKDGNGIYYSGYSAVIDPMGKRMFEQAHDEVVKSVTLRANTVEKIRTRLPFLNDADQFKIN